MKSESTFYRGNALLQFVYALVIILAVMALAWWVLRREASVSRDGRPDSAQSGAKVITGCGVEFELPEGWELTKQSPDTAKRCQINLDLADHALRDSSDIEGNYIVGLETFKSQFDSLMDRSGFVHGDSGWVAKGRQGMESPAVAVSRAPWRGVQGVPTIGCFSKSSGTYAGLCDVPVAALITGDFAVFLEGGPEAEQAFTRVLMTLKVKSGK